MTKDDDRPFINYRVASLVLNCSICEKHTVQVKEQEVVGS